MVFGQKIVYADYAGAGPTIVLLHGLGGSTDHWRFTTPALSGRHVVVMDQLGFGKSDKPAINYRVSTLVDMLHEFLSRAGITKATLVGHSMGGWVAADYARRFPDQVDRLVLVGSGGYSQERWGGPPATLDGLLALNPSSLDTTRAQLKRLFANQALVTEPAVRAAWELRLGAGDGGVITSFIESALRREDYLDGLLGSVTTPTLLLWGREDVLMPLAVANAFKADLPHAELTVFERCGHMPQLECAPLFNAALAAFLKKP